MVRTVLTLLAILAALVVVTCFGNPFALKKVEQHPASSATVNVSLSAAPKVDTFQVVYQVQDDSTSAYHVFTVDKAGHYDTMTSENALEIEAWYQRMTIRNQPFVAKIGKLPKKKDNRPPVFSPVPAPRYARGACFSIKRVCYNFLHEKCNRPGIFHYHCRSIHCGRSVLGQSSGKSA